MCFSCRMNEIIVKSIKSPIHLANLHASAVYRSMLNKDNLKKQLFPK